MTPTSPLLRNQMKFEDLEQKYIHLFECNENGVPLRGIECGNGWLKHIEAMLSIFDWYHLDLPPLTNEEKENGCYEIKIFQIKEKFGRLRIYFEAPKGIYNILENVVHHTIGKCELTCESCGKIEDIKPTIGWISYLCKKCKKSKGK